ncbi:MAG: CPBP family intramembrane glutamic endopeptidase [Actinomycetota bacterium]
MALTALVVGLGAYDIIRRLAIPGQWSPWANTAMIGGVAAVAALAGLTVDEVGLARRHLGAGVRWGAVGTAAVGAVVLAARGIAGPMPSLTADHVGVSGWEMLLTVFVRIPIATVLFEELAFRGTMLPLLRRVTHEHTAWATSSVLFGMWHLAPIWGSSTVNLFGTFAATVAGGAAFIWLRVRSQSLVAPLMVHWATNGLALLIVWLLR